MSLIFIFLDGVGLAAAGPDNPLASADTPALRALLGGPLTIEQVRGWETSAAQGERTDGGCGPDLLVPPASSNPQTPIPILFKAIDATLGVDGLPQSGT